MRAEYIDRIYAGWLAKIIGIRLGAPVEGWTNDQIAEKYGEIDGYLVDYQDFAADDDSNGPFFFVRALREGKHFPTIQPQDVGDALLNYAGYQHGFFWFGGYGVSTEHTAYENLWSGIPAPRSGSALQNGSAVAEQIGGQIFIDCWGLVCPGNEKRAAQLARAAASVTHDGNGIWGGIFVAVCISHAFVEREIGKIIQKGLEFIPPDCEYAAVVRAVTDFYSAHPQDWRKCLDYIRADWGYDRYPGNCHIIPNTAVMILSLLYGEGNFDRTLAICCMCGWDTDCNVGNVATIMGVRGGLSEIDYDKWRAPINDFVVFSSVAGALNIPDIPEGASYMAQLSYLLDGETPPEPWERIWERGRSLCHFSYPGSTHGLRIRSGGNGKMENISCHTAGGGRALRVEMTGADESLNEIYLKTYYEPADFYDSRYDPSFSPRVYPGQRICCRLCLEASADGKQENVEVRLYARLRGAEGEEDEILYSEACKLGKEEWDTLSWRIPGGSPLLVKEIGLQCATCGDKTSLLLDEFYTEGAAEYEIDFARERTEKWNDLHREISQFTRQKGLCYLEDKWLHLAGTDFGEAYTGDWDWADYEAEFELMPILGEVHYALVRVQGALRSYGIGFTGNGRFGISKKDREWKVLAEIPYTWENGVRYRFTVKVEKERIQVFQDGKEILSAQDSFHPWLQGGIGVSVGRNSHCGIRRIRICVRKM